MTWDEIFILIARAQTGDRAAFGELVERFQPAVYAVALARLRDPNEATELAQEVFIHAMTKIDQLRDPHCFVGWLRQITVRMAINRVTRKAPVQGAEPEFLQNAPDAEAGPLDEHDPQRRPHGRLERAGSLEAARPRHAGRVLHQGPILEADGREFETPVGTIKRRLHVARNRLKSAMEKAQCAARRRACKPATQSSSPLPCGRGVGGEGEHDHSPPRAFSFPKCPSRRSTPGCKTSQVPFLKGASITQLGA